MTTIHAPSTHIALDAAAPIAQIAAILPVGTRASVRYSLLGETIHAHYLKGYLDTGQRMAVVTTVTTTFHRAGWTYSNRYCGDGETIRSTRFTHPINATRIGRPGTDPHTLSLALHRAARALGQSDAIERLAPHMAPEEIESLARLLIAADHTDAGAAWIRTHPSY
ncbi:hypothetical protein [Kitasatospora cineracea]|uniref:hypothetical protein n=1 Tax=Kitasatospora cineracea TaxID=88074 RepID=UPI0033E604FE